MKKISVYLQPTVLWLTLLMLIGLNIWLKRQPTPPDWPLRLNILKNPTSVDYHLKLAQFYWQQHLKALGSHEIAVAETLSAFPVLGASHSRNQIDPQSLLSTWQEEVNNLNGQYSYWQEIISSKPEYRDAYLVLGSLALRLGRKPEAVRWLDQARKLDPNYSLTTKMLQEITALP